MLTKLFLPFFKFALKRAVVRHQLTPNDVTTAKLAKALFRAGKADEAYATITTGRKLYSQSGVVARTYEFIRVRYAKHLLARTMLSLKGDKRVENFIRAADLLRTLGHTEKALAILEKLHTQNANNWAVEYALGQVFFNRFKDTGHPADLTDSLLHLRMARDNSPNNYKVLFFSALVCSGANLVEEAIENLDAILALVPMDPKALALRRQIEARGRRTDGRATTRAPVSRAPAPAAVARALASTDDDLPSRCLDQVLEAPESLAAFALSSEGEILASRTKQSQLFDFSECDDSVCKMVQGSIVDSDHIGIGRLRACVLTGDGWQVSMKAFDRLSIIAFFEGVHPSGLLSQLLEDLAVEA